MHLHWQTSIIILNFKTAAKQKCPARFTDARAAGNMSQIKGHCRVAAELLNSSEAEVPGSIYGCESSRKYEPDKGALPRSCGTGIGGKI